MSGHLDEFERREAERRARFVGARILSPEGLAIAAATICNLSSSGAMLRSFDCAGLERGFCMLIDGESRLRHCVIAWKSGNQVGVRFVQPEASAATIAADLLSREAVRAGWTPLSG